MKGRVSEIVNELKTIGSGRTIDAVLPPIIFLITNRLIELNIAVIAALSVAVILGIMRLLRRQTWFYAVGGFMGVSLASGLAYITRSAAGYFIPAIITSIFLLLLALISQLIGKPLAAWASHLTRGWPLEWFWRQDIKPAYREVTWMWTGFLTLRLTLQILLFRAGEASQLTWANALLGWPFTILVLILSYIYGIWRLRNLGGPGVEEFQQDSEPPWEGQKKGF